MLKYSVNNPCCSVNKVKYKQVNMFLFVSVLPAVIVGISLGATKLEGYGNEDL